MKTNFLDRGEMMDRYVSQNVDETTKDLLEHRRKAYLEDPKNQAKQL